MQETEFTLDRAAVDKYLNLKKSGSSEEDALLNVYAGANTASFPVYSHKSLYPYFHKLMTGKNIIVASFFRRNKARLIGYSASGHRVSRDIDNPARVTDILLPLDSYEYAPQFIWISVFLKNKEYIDGDRDKKLRLIREYAQQH